MTAITFALSLVLIANPPTTSDPAVMVDVDQVHAILQARCVKCHGPKRQKGHLRLDQRSIAIGEYDGEGVIVPGDPGASVLMQRITLPADDLDIMPAEGDALTSEEIDLIRRWIEAGAAWPERAAEVDPLERIALPALTVAEAAAREQAIGALRERGVLVTPVSAESHALDVSFAFVGRRIEDSDLALLEPLAPSLVWLDFGRTSVTDDQLRFLGPLGEIRRVHLERTGIEGAGLRHLRDHERMWYLNLYGTAVDDEAVAHLSEMRELRRIYVWRTRLTDDGFERLRRALPGCEVVAGPPALAVATPEKRAPPSCCVAAEEAGTTCDHACCIEARDAGMVCERCAK